MVTDAMVAMPMRITTKRMIEIVCELALRFVKQNSYRSYSANTQPRRNIECQTGYFFAQHHSACCAYANECNISFLRRESSVEEALIEMCLAGVSVRRVEVIVEALWGTKVSPGTISEMNKKAYVHFDAWRWIRFGRRNIIAIKFLPNALLEWQSIFLNLLSLKMSGSE